MFTMGPWEKEPYGFGVERVVSHCGPERGKVTICTTVSENAKLIVMAPEMHAFIKKIADGDGRGEFSQEARRLTEMAEGLRSHAR